MPHTLTVDTDGAILAPTPFDSGPHEAAAAWAAHVDAGRLAAARGPRTRPETTARRARMAALLLGRPLDQA